MKDKIIIYGGTTEGRILAETLAAYGIPVLVCVVTSYGSEVMPSHPLIEVKVGRQDEEEMLLFLGTGEPLAVVDATHPYALVVTGQIRKCTEQLGLTLYRLKRDTQVDIGENKEGVYCFRDAEECSHNLVKTEGNILLTTGSKDLEIFAADPGVRERLYVRVLPGRESLELCERAGLAGKQIIAMQGPFSKEMNLALIHQYRINCLVTKESGTTGGFYDKLDAAREAGITAFLIDSPKEDSGEDLNAVLEHISLLTGKKQMRPVRRITLAGSGMGGVKGLTQEAYHAVLNARYLFGAKRLVEPFQDTKDIRPIYLAKDIIPCLEELSALDGGVGDVVVLFSGDTGFYSGAEKLGAALSENNLGEVRVLPGISSVSALSAKTGISWQDAALCSIHGRQSGYEAEVADKVRKHEKTILLLSDREQLQKVCQLLERSGLGACRMMLGGQLSYASEILTDFTVSGWKEVLYELPEKGLYTVMVLNAQKEPQRCSYGLPEESFVRGKVPMTKEEVRSIVLGKLRLYDNSCVYDIGSGTGSVAVEIASMSPKIRVFALECHEEACELIRINKENAHVHNLELIRGIAPDSMRELPTPTHAFIGGSRGRLFEILEDLYEKNNGLRVVITAISLETVKEMVEIEERFPVTDYEMVQVQVGRNRKVLGHQLMQGENPVMICSFTFTKRVDTL